MSQLAVCPRPLPAINRKQGPCRLQRHDKTRSADDISEVKPCATKSREFDLQGQTQQRTLAIGPCRWTRPLELKSTQRDAGHSRIRVLFQVPKVIASRVPRPVAHVWATQPALRLRPSRKTIGGDRADAPEGTPGTRVVQESCAPPKLRNTSQRRRRTLLRAMVKLTHAPMAVASSSIYCTDGVSGMLLDSLESDPARADRGSSCSDLSPLAREE